MKKNMILLFFVVLLFVGCSNKDGSINDVKKVDKKPTTYNITDISKANVGDYIKFGKYEQDNNMDNGAEPIEWQIIEIKDGKAFLLSRYVLTNSQYDDSKDEENAIWSKCTLRKWLNYTFIRNIFSNEEQELVLESTIKNPSTVGVVNIEGTDCGEDTTDKLFLLSLDEVRRFFNCDTNNMGTIVNDKAACDSSQYILNTVKLGITQETFDKYYKEDNYPESVIGNVEWGLRSNSNEHSVFSINETGSISCFGVGVSILGIRPACYVSVK